jgi:hypothetical protein
VRIEDFELSFEAVSLAGEIIDQFTLTAPGIAVPGPAEDAAAPGMALEPLYPNPFNPATSIEFHLPEPSAIELKVFDLRGAPVRTLLAGDFPAGRQRCEWNGIDDAGRRASSGIYFIRLEAAGRTLSRRAVLLK